MVQKLIAFGFILLLCFGFVQAEKSYEKDSPINFTVSCNDISCAGDVNLTILDPKGAPIIDNVLMVPKTGYQQYSLSSSQTATRGTHSFYVSSATNDFSGTFEITTTGEQLSTGEALVYILLLTLVVFVVVIFVRGAFQTPWSHKRNEYGQVIAVNWKKLAKITYVAGAYLFTMWAFGILTALSRSFSSLIAFEKFFEYFYLVMLYVTYPLVIVTVILLLVVYFKNKVIDKQLRRGFELW